VNGVYVMDADEKTTAEKKQIELYMAATKRRTKYPFSIE